MRDDWRRLAACLGISTDLFFPDDRGRTAASGDSYGTGLAKEVCRTCPVSAECLAAGMREDHGVWGGESARQRRAMRRNRAFDELRRAGR